MSNTMIYIAIGVGAVLALGGIGYVVYLSKANKFYKAGTQGKKAGRKGI